MALYDGPDGRPSPTGPRPLALEPSRDQAVKAIRQLLVLDAIAITGSALLGGTFVTIFLLLTSLGTFWLLVRHLANGDLLAAISFARISSISLAVLAAFIAWGWWLQLGPPTDRPVREPVSVSQTSGNQNGENPTGQLGQGGTRMPATERFMTATD